jgi:hypothetical protein
VIRCATVALLFATLAVPPTSADATVTRACTSRDLGAVAYTAGLASGTEYVAIAVTNKGRRICRVGRQPELLTGPKSRPSVASAGRTTETLRGSVALRSGTLRSGERALVLIRTTPVAEQPDNADCQLGKQHSRDRITGLRLETETIIALTNPFSVERCLRKIGPFADDAWLLSCPPPNTILEAPCRRL